MARNAPEAPRKKIGSFEVERELGQGGMGLVYLALQPGLERWAVLKTLRRDLTENEELELRFEREAQAAARVHHQNVVCVYDCFSWRGERFIAQEFVDGLDLASALQAVGRLEPRVAALVALEIARGLEEIHEQGVVHRDLKPSNVLIGRSGEVKIADFGIALDAKGKTLTRTGHTVGTPLYMSLEQLLGERAEYRSDLYSLGVVLYEMVAGHAPFAESDDPDAALIRRVESGRHPALRKVEPATPRALAKLVQACLRPKAKRRPASATIVRRALEGILGSPPPGECRDEIAEFFWSRKVFRKERNRTVRQVKKPETAPTEVPSAWPRRLRWAVATGGVAAVLWSVAAAGLVAVERVESVLSQVLMAAR